MSMGWYYPPGAEHDPRAPWNQPEPDEDEPDESEPEELPDNDDD